MFFVPQLLQACLCPFNLGRWGRGVPGEFRHRLAPGGLPFLWSRNDDAVVAVRTLDLPSGEAGLAFEVLPAVNAGEFERCFRGVLCSKFPFLSFPPATLSTGSARFLISQGQGIYPGIRAHLCGPRSKCRPRGRFHKSYIVCPSPPSRKVQKAVSDSIPPERESQVFHSA